MVLNGLWQEWTGPTYQVEVGMFVEGPGWTVQAGGYDDDPYTPFDDSNSTDTLIGEILAENNGPHSVADSWAPNVGFPGDDSDMTWCLTQISTLPDNEFSDGPRINPANVQMYRAKVAHTNMASINEAVLDALVTPPTLPDGAEYYQWESSFSSLVGDIEITGGTYRSGCSAEALAAGAPPSGGAIYFSTLTNNVFKPLSEVQANSTLAVTVPSTTTTPIPPTSVSVMDVYGSEDAEDQGDLFAWTYNDSLLYPGSAIRPRPSGLYTYETLTRDLTVTVTCRPPRYRFAYTEPVTGANLHPLRQRQFYW